MRSNQLIINAVRDLYLRHNGRCHRAIEREMHALGCRRFSRRVLYNQKTAAGVRLGWIERFGWKAELARLADAPSSSSRPGTGPFPHQPSSSSPTGTDTITGGECHAPHLLPALSPIGTNSVTFDRTSLTDS